MGVAEVVEARGMPVVSVVVAVEEAGWVRRKRVVMEALTAGAVEVEARDLLGELLEVVEVAVMQEMMRHLVVGSVAAEHVEWKAQSF